MNTRTEAVWSKEQSDELIHTRSYEGPSAEDDLTMAPLVNLGKIDFEDDDDIIGKGEHALEGDCRKGASCMTSIQFVLS